MTIATVDDIASGLAAAQQRRVTKNITAPKAAGAFQSAWLATGQPPAGAAPPVYTNGSGYTSDKSTTGAILYSNGAVQNWLAKLNMACSQPGVLYIADRLWSCSGMGFAAATYTVTTPGALPARITDNGVACELWCEQFVTAGAASGTLVAAYLDADGSAQSGTIAAVVSAPIIGQMQPIPLANNRGVKQLTSLTNNATWTSGTFGATILKPLAEIVIPTIGIGQTLDWAALGLPQIPADACLFAYFLAQNTTAPVAVGSLSIIDK